MMNQSQKCYYVTMPDKSQQKVSPLSPDKKVCVWSRHPTEFGAPYRLHFVDDEGDVVRLGVGIFLPDNGGGWYIWGGLKSYAPAHFVTYEMEPLHYIGSQLQYFQHFQTATSARVILPEDYRVLSLKNFSYESALFGSKEILEGTTGQRFNPIITKYSDLIPVGRDTYKVECPMCDEGVLLLRRDPVTWHLLPDDNCISCGQSFHYVDINPTTPISLHGS